MSAISITEINRDEGPTASSQPQGRLKELYSSSYHAPVPVSGIVPRQILD